MEECVSGGVSERRRQHTHTLFLCLSEDGKTNMSNICPTYVEQSEQKCVRQSEQESLSASVSECDTCHSHTKLCGETLVTRRQTKTLVTRRQRRV